ncbi:MFS transporter [Hyphomicrobiales bacterium]|nr:MFS transporter [Hyphomicrobiales bacterium]CAH1698763.1 MFS transporter [Hyphomicrobiales bacterium]CAI0342410.1 MFS transporter, PPP family, 3-phenylpropionic acid transporter [Hyphomicrobiales bacterium]
MSPSPIVKMCRPSEAEPESPAGDRRSRGLVGSASIGGLSILYAFLFFELGVNLPFFPLWLQAQSLDSDAIGIILAAPLLARIVANPVVGALADRSGRLSMALTFCAVLVAVGTGLLTVVQGFWPILAVVIAIALAQGPLIALADAMTLGRLAGVPRSELIYGRIRLWGSLGFAAANLVAGWLFEWFSAALIVGLLLMSAVLTAAAAAFCTGPATRRLRAAPRDDAPLTHPWLLAGAIAGAALVQASHAAFYGFGTLHWQAGGLSGAAMGGLWALGVLSEVVLFAMLGYRMRGPASAAWLLAMAAAVAILRWAGMSQDPGLPGLVVLQLTHGVTFGITHLASVFLLAGLAPGRMQARAQAWLAGGWAGAMAVLTTFCGRLYEGWGEQIYLMMALVAAIGLSLLLPVAVFLGRGVLRGASNPG